MSEIALDELLALRVKGRRNRNGLGSDCTEIQEQAASNALVRLSELVEAQLPWTSPTTGRPHKMRVADAGYLDWDHPLFPAGTAFVLVVVDSPEAANAVREALAPIARLDEISWIIDWAREPGAYASIQVFPRTE